MLVTRKYTYLVENVGFIPRFDSKSSPLLPKYDKTPVADVSPLALLLTLPARLWREPVLSVLPTLMLLRPPHLKQHVRALRGISPYPLPLGPQRARMHSGPLTPYPS